MNSTHIDLLLRLTGLFGILWAGLLLLKVSHKGSSFRDDVGLISGKDLRIVSWVRLFARGITFILGILVVGGSASSIHDLVMKGSAVTVSVPFGRSANVSVGTGTSPDGAAHHTSTQMGEGTAANGATP